jgi:hypothetical protein
MVSKACDAVLPFAGEVSGAGTRALPLQDADERCNGHSVGDFETTRAIVVCRLHLYQMYQSYLSITKDNLCERHRVHHHSKPGLSLDDDEIFEVHKQCNA